MKRRDFLCNAAAGVVAAACSGSVAAEQPPARPNILLYVTDDHGTNDAGCYGNPLIRTPGLDLLAEEGTRFTYGFCTCSTCSPSRAVLLTGMYNHANGQYGLAHGRHHFASFAGVQSLPVMLADGGYRTASVGKYHVAPEAAYHFAEYLPGGSPEQMADNCREFIQAGGNAPFFLYFCTSEPHRPFRREGSVPVDPKDVIVPPYLPDTPECRDELAQYYGSVERADKGLLRLIAILRETGHWEDTVIVYVSDNGIAFPGAKTTLYEPGIHLPCVVRDPAQAQQGGVCNAMINWADITPTLLDFAGVKPEKPQYQGRSFRAALGQEHPEGWDATYASHTTHEVTMYYPMRVVRTRRYKLIWNLAHTLEYPFASDLWKSSTWQGVLERGDTQYGPRTVEAFLHRPRFELYDLESDPLESKNLADNPQYAAVLAELKGKLKAFQERTKDPWILKWDRE